MDKFKGKVVIIDEAFMGPDGIIPEKREEKISSSLPSLDEIQSKSRINRRSQDLEELVPPVKLDESPKKISIQQIQQRSRRQPDFYLEPPDFSSIKPSTAKDKTQNLPEIDLDSENSEKMKRLLETCDPLIGEKPKEGLITIKFMKTRDGRIVSADNSPKTCSHSKWIKYEGLTESYEFCEQCDTKRNIK